MIWGSTVSPITAPLQEPLKEPVDGLDDHRCLFQSVVLRAQSYLQDPWATTAHVHFFNDMRKASDCMHAVPCLSVAL